MPTPTILAQDYLSCFYRFSTTYFSILCETTLSERSSRDRDFLKKKNLITSENWSKSWHLKLQWIQIHMIVSNLGIQILSLLSFLQDIHFLFPQMSLKKVQEPSTIGQQFHLPKKKKKVSFKNIWSSTE